MGSKKAEWNENSSVNICTATSLLQWISFQLVLLVQCTICYYLEERERERDREREREREREN